MLLGKMGDKMRADIERTNRGEKRPAVDDAPRAPTPAAGNPATGSGRNRRAGIIDPVALENVPDTFIKELLDGQDNMAEVKRNTPGYLHVSALLKSTCARKMRLEEQSTAPQYESVHGGMRVVWRIGRAVESHIREQYIKAIKFKGVIGTWACKCGDTTYNGIHDPRATVCAFCRTQPHVYNELTLKDDEVKICGNPDLLSTLGDEVTAFEIKSIKHDGPDGWDALTAPLPDHVYQVSAYRRLGVSNGMNMNRYAYVIYCTKSYVFGSPYKVFKVDTTTQQVTALLDEVWAVAREVQESRRAKSLPARTVCATPETKKAKSCAMCTDCFMRS